MKTLLLNRHAEAASAKDTDDFSRPLTPHGHEQAKALSKVLAQKALKPDVWLSSPALRAITTAQIAADGAGILSIQREAKIYEADEQTLLHIINSLSDGYTFAALTGHNPGISYLFYALCGEARDITPCTALLITFDVPNWAEISAGTGSLKWYAAP